MSRGRQFTKEYKEITQLEGLTGQQKRVLSAFQTQFEWKGIVDISISYLAQKLKISVSTVKRSISKLKQLNLIRVVKSEFGKIYHYTVLEDLKNDKREKDIPVQNVVQTLTKQQKDRDINETSTWVKKNHNIDNKNNNFYKKLLQKVLLKNNSKNIPMSDLWEVPKKDLDSRSEDWEWIMDQTEHFKNYYSLKKESFRCSKKGWRTLWHRWLDRAKAIKEYQEPIQLDQNDLSVSEKKLIDLVGEGTFISWLKGEVQEVANDNIILKPTSLFKKEAIQTNIVPTLSKHFKKIMWA